MRLRRGIGGWSPEEAAGELHRCRADLIGELRGRSESSGVPLVAQEEIVDDAVTAVVMSPRGVTNEHHLLGAFWLAVDHRCRSRPAERLGCGSGRRADGLGLVQWERRPRAPARP
jgi:hypothetical protein